MLSSARTQTREPIYDEMFRRLEDGATFAEVADWLNGLGIRPGPYCRCDQWDHAMVARVVSNPIVKGVRVRNRKMSRRINKTGRRRSVDAPPEERRSATAPTWHPSNPTRFDRVNAPLARRNSKFKCRRKDADRSPQERAEEEDAVARAASRMRYLWAAVPHSVVTVRPITLLCAGATEYACWNATSADGPGGRETCRRHPDGDHRPS